MRLGHWVRVKFFRIASRSLVVLFTSLFAVATVIIIINVQKSHGVPQSGSVRLSACLPGHHNNMLINFLSLVSSGAPEDAGRSSMKFRESRTKLSVRNKNANDRV